MKGYIKFVKIPTFYAEYGDILVVSLFCVNHLLFFNELEREGKKCQSENIQETVNDLKKRIKYIGECL